MIKIAICDDDLLFLDQIEKMLKIYERENAQRFIIKKYIKPMHLMGSLKEKFQVFFLDMQMPETNGYELADFIRKYDRKSTIIFVTSYHQYIFDCFKYEAANYIIKPMTQVQINYEMNRAIEKINSGERAYLPVKNSKGYMKLFLSDIQYIETTKDRNVLFHCSDSRKEIGHFKMQNLEDRLRDFSFVRCHNGIIVNVNYIEQIYGLTITLVSGDIIYTTKSRKKAVMQKVAECAGCI